jgi:predicted metal-dependent hydrolase
MISSLSTDQPDRALDPHYLEFVECFNRQHFFQAHEVLEQLWLPERQGPNGLFFKGLIQLAGAFVHLQKDRLGPAAALFRLARANLEKYPASHEQLDVGTVLKLIAGWLAQVESVRKNPLSEATAPTLRLLTDVL